MSATVAKSTENVPSIPGSVRNFNSYLGSGMEFTQPHQDKLVPA